MAEISSRIGLGHSILRCVKAVLKNGWAGFGSTINRLSCILNSAVILCSKRFAKKKRPSEKPKRVSDNMDGPWADQGPDGRKRMLKIGRAHV